MSKHTPGPWFINLESEDCEKGKLSVEAERFFIAQIDECLAQEANARLIAAAPDLLVFITEWLNRQGGDSNYMTEKARAAIAKATGEQS